MGDAFDGGVEAVAEDLQAAGYLVFAVYYRLAPCGTIIGQHVHDLTTDGIASGRPLQQTNDIKALVRAARADSRCNLKVGTVGGSGGGSHAVWVALDTNPTVPSTDWPKWQGASDLVDCAVSLSGAYDYSDRIDTTGIYEILIINYTNTAERTQQLALSPVSLITSSSIKPLYLLNTDGDSMPYHQILAIQCVLQEHGVNANLYQILTLLNNDKHAFAYWHDWDGLNPQHRVSDDVIAFLNAHLK
jgi:acetyl esterase/lipase